MLAENLKRVVIARLGFLFAFVAVLERWGLLKQPHPVPNELLYLQIGNITHVISVHNFLEISDRSSESVPG